MTFKLALQLSTATILIVVAIRQCVQVVRHRSDLALRLLAAGLVVLSFTATIGIRDFAPTVAIFSMLYRIKIGAIISNGSWMAMAYCFATFFLMADTTRDVAVRKRGALRGIVILLLVVICTQFIIERYYPEAFHGGPEKYHHWANIADTALILGYDLTFWSIGLCRAVRYLRSVTHVWLRISLSLVISGVAAMAIGVDGMSVIKSILRLAIPGSFRFEPTSAIYIVGLLGGQAALAIGLVLPALAAGVVKAQRRFDRVLQRRYNRQMAPLWRTLTTAFPYVVLPQQDAPVNTHTAEQNFDRTINEISDGLAELSPYYAADTGRQSSGRPGGRDINAVAEGVRAALDAHAADVQSAGQPPYPRIEPDFRGWRGRAQWMVRLSRELKELGVGPSSSAPSAGASTHIRTPPLGEGLR